MEGKTKSQQYPFRCKLIVNSNDVIVAERRLSIEDDLYLDHHRFNNIPYLPGVFGLEIFAELAKAIFPDREISEFIDVEFRSAVRLKDDNPVCIRTSLRKVDDKIHAILELLIKKNESTDYEKKQCFIATMVFNQKNSEKQEVPQMKKIPLLNKEIIYQLLPHKSLLHVISEINHLGEEVVALGHFKERQFFKWKHDRLLVNPLPIEASFQTIGLMDFINTGKAGLPSKIGRIEFFNTNAKPHFIIGRKISENNFTFKVLSKNGDVLLKAEDYQIVEVNLGDTFSALEKIRSHKIRLEHKIPRRAWLEVVSLELLKDKISRESNFIETFIQPDELEFITGLSEEKKLENISEIYALKRVLKIVLFTKDMLKFTIQRNQDNDLFCQFKRKTIYLSTKKIDGYILAMASYNRKVDIELVENGY